MLVRRIFILTHTTRFQLFTQNFKLSKRGHPQVFAAKTLGSDNTKHSLFQQVRDELSHWTVKGLPGTQIATSYKTRLFFHCKSQIQFQQGYLGFTIWSYTPPPAAISARAITTLRTLVCISIVVLSRDGFKTTQYQHLLSKWIKITFHKFMHAGERFR